MGVNWDLSICSLFHILLYGHSVYTCTCVFVSWRKEAKGDVMFGDIIADVQGVQIRGHTPYSCLTGVSRPGS